MTSTKTLNEIKRAAPFFFPITLGVLAIFYWRWFWLAPNEAGYLFEIPLLFFYGVFAALSKTSRLRRYMLFGTFVFFFINCLRLIFGMPTLITSVDCDGKTYSILYYPYSLDGGSYKVTTWKGLFNYSSAFFGYDALYSSSTLTCDRYTNEVRVFVLSFDVLLQSYGAETHTYEMKSRDWAKDFEYSLYTYDVNGVEKYTISTCRRNLPTTCQFMPIDYSSSQDELASFLFDRITGSFSILFQGDHGITYTDLHAAPQKVKIAATYIPTPAYLGKAYQVISYPTNHSFAYIFYRCHRLDVQDLYNECDTIPLSYTTPDEQDASLDFDKTADKLTLSIGGKLVFTYDHPFKH